MPIDFRSPPQQITARLELEAEYLDYVQKLVQEHNARFKGSMTLNRLLSRILNRSIHEALHEDRQLTV
ncbi:hypothetical protein [Marinivivus vitaminiproducens]|uniref:hypothetical protein n=1 Tax=Marinivivus vitaminiproducens TaxID=3035935 RepID=UPI0027995B68|nr:hypothetical protein P4R82_24650 [Geminicoccaceae bacterium SCSIO 64248]